MNPLIVCAHLFLFCFVLFFVFFFFLRLSLVEREKILKRKEKGTKGFRTSLSKTNDVQSLLQMDLGLS